MNFHISNLSPLRPKFSSSSLTSPRPQSSSSRGHPSISPVKIAVEPADGSTDTDGDDDESISDTSANDDVTQDSRDVLVQRLTDLAARLSSGDAHVRTAGIEALHRQVDEMERVLTRGAGASSRRGSSLMRPRSLQLPAGGSADSGSGDAGMGRDALGIMAPMSPSWLMTHFQRRQSMHLETQTAEVVEEPPEKEEIGDPVEALRLETLGEERTPKEEPLHPMETPQVQPPRPFMNRLASLDSSTTAPRISSQVAEDAIKEAEKLCAEMATVITSLQTRREESDHLQAVLVQREALSHQRLHETAVAAGELEDVVAENEAELRHLRLELRALEVQCMDYVPKGADPQLGESIRNWKDDWRALRDKWALRRGSSFVSADDSSTT